MKTYDFIIILGSQPDTKTWKFPAQIYKCLDKSTKLLKAGAAPYIITSGLHSIALDNRDIKQPFKECDALADYLIKEGVPKDKILREDKSKDTISNLYYLKTQFLLPKKTHKLLFVIADFRVPRLKFLCQRILGPEYEVVFETVEAKQGTTYDEPHTFKIQSEFLEPMKDGDHDWLQDKFYKSSIYDYWAKHHKASDILPL